MIRSTVNPVPIDSEIVFEQREGSEGSAMGLFYKISMLNVCVVVVEVDEHLVELHRSSTGNW